MELAGLEPATSWVRSIRPLGRELGCVQPFSGERLDCRNISRNILQSVFHRDNARVSACGLIAGQACKSGSVNGSRPRRRSTLQRSDERS